MVKYATENYAKTVVVINSSHAMELGRLEDNAGVDAVLWVGSPGRGRLPLAGRHTFRRGQSFGQNGRYIRRRFHSRPFVPQRRNVRIYRAVRGRRGGRHAETVGQGVDDAVRRGNIRRLQVLRNRARRGAERQLLRLRLRLPPSYTPSVTACLIRRSNRAWR